MLCCVYVCVLCASLVFMRVQKGHRAPGTRVMRVGYCQPSCRCWDLNLGPLYHRAIFPVPKLLMVCSQKNQSQMMWWLVLFFNLIKSRVTREESSNEGLLRWDWPVHIFCGLVNWSEKKHHDCWKYHPLVLGPDLCRRKEHEQNVVISVPVCSWLNVTAFLSLCNCDFLLS